MKWLLPTVVAISSLPSWWWTKGPGLGDPAESNSNRFLVAGITLAFGLGTAAILGKNTLTNSVAAFAGARIGVNIITALNPQPLPPEARE